MDNITIKLKQEEGKVRVSAYEENLLVCEYCYYDDSGFEALRQFLSTFKVKYRNFSMLKKNF